jgi:hypothetical protein
LAWAPLEWPMIVALSNACAKPQTGSGNAARQQRPGEDLLHGVSGVHMVFPSVASGVRSRVSIAGVLA